MSKEYRLPLKNSDIDTRKKRKRVLKVIRAELDRIHFAEGMCLVHFPKNLRNSPSCEAGETAMDLIEDAIIALDEAYDS
jgi:hypothetical protein